MTLKEMKRKLSEIIGINLFEPKYKEIDKILGNGENTENAAEFDVETDKKEPVDAPGENAEDSEPENITEPDSEDEELSANDDSIEEQKDGESEFDAGNEEADAGEQSDDNQPESEMNSEESEADGIEAELFDAKLEAALLRVGIREEKLDAAKKLFKADHTLSDIGLVEKWAKDYPEWLEQKTKRQAVGFGMGVGENDVGETAEEKRLRELGII